MLTLDQDEDLRWYFQDSLGDCGAKSHMGPQLDALAAGVVGKPTGYRPKLPRAELCQAVQEAQLDADMADVLLSGMAEERRVYAASRANRIGARLKRIGRTSNVVLELHYADAHRCNGVGIDLLANTSKAEELHRLSIERTKKSKAHTMSVREWILWLITRAAVSESSRTVLKLIVDEAKDALSQAQAAYANVDGRSIQRSA